MRLRRMLNLENIPPAATTSSRPASRDRRHLFAALRGGRPSDRSALDAVHRQLQDAHLAQGGVRTFRAQATPASADAGRGAVFVLHDISDLRRADRIRRDFVANVSRARTATAIEATSKP